MESETATTGVIKMIIFSTGAHAFNFVISRIVNVFVENELNI